MTSDEWADFLSQHPEVDRLRNATAWRPPADKHTTEPAARDIRSNHPTSQSSMDPHPDNNTGHAVVARLPMGGAMVASPHDGGVRIRIDLPPIAARNWALAHEHSLTTDHDVQPCPVDEMLERQWMVLMVTVAHLMGHNQ